MMSFIYLEPLIKSVNAKALADKTKTKWQRGRSYTLCTGSSKYNGNASQCTPSAPDKWNYNTGEYDEKEHLIKHETSRAQLIRHGATCATSPFHFSRFGGANTAQER